MINIPIDFVRTKMEASPHIVAGRNLIERLISDNIVPDNIHPIIAGGAVRDVFFKNQTPHDVDIFLARPYNAQAFNVIGEDSVTLFIEDFVCWADDNEVELRRLTQEEREDYNGGNSIEIVEIFELSWMDQTIQIMFNRTTSLTTVCDSFPIMARFFLSKDFLHFTRNSYLSIQLQHPVVVSPRDMRYVAKKYPNSTVHAFVNVGEMAAAVIRDMVGIYTSNINEFFGVGFEQGRSISNTHLNSNRNITERQIVHSLELDERAAQVPNGTFIQTFDGDTRLCGNWSEGLVSFRQSGSAAQPQSNLTGTVWDFSRSRPRSVADMVRPTVREQIQSAMGRNLQGSFEARPVDTITTLGASPQNAQAARTMEEVRRNVNEMAHQAATTFRNSTAGLTFGSTH